MAQRIAGPTMRPCWLHLACALAAACVISLPLHSHAQTQQRCTVTMQQEVAGALISRSDGQGKVSVDFSYRNNGRGPELSEELSVDALGAPVSYAGSGKSTFGNEIRENYAWQDGRGRWTSLVDRGTSPCSGCAVCSHRRQPDAGRTAGALAAASCTA